MIDAIKKTLLAGIGAVVITNDKIESALNELVKQGKISTAEARQMAEKIADQGRREFETLSHEVNEKLRDKFSGEERRSQKRLDALEARVAALERASSYPPSDESPPITGL
jgi:polyhydroxyalkanoate synthesis regulator phasin